MVSDSMRSDGCTYDESGVGQAYLIIVLTSTWRRIRDKAGIEFIVAQFFSI